MSEEAEQITAVDETSVENSESKDEPQATEPQVPESPPPSPADMEEAPVVADATEEPEPKPEPEQKKSVTFGSNLTFDEAQAEIDSIKARAGKARESLQSSQSSATPSYTPSSSTTASYMSDEMPKSKNMLSHLNSHSAMLNYKVNAARSLVRKQEDLLRNLARMRENMERSENELGKASDYYTPNRHLPRKYDYRSDAISRRQVSGLMSASPQTTATTDFESSIHHKAASPAPVSLTSSFSVSADPKPLPSSSSSDYQLDENFEKEMAAIRRRVAAISKQANDVTSSSRYRGYDDIYDMPDLSTSYLRNTTSDDLYNVPDSLYEVKYSTTPYYPRAPSVYSQTTPVYLHEPSHDVEVSSFPQNSYADYLMDSLNEYPAYSSSPSNQYDAYYDPYPYDVDTSVLY